MAKITGGESSLLGGVSQQPDDRRLRGSLQELVNTNTDVLRGIERRPPIDGAGEYFPEPLYTTQQYKHIVINTRKFVIRFDYNRGSDTDLEVRVVSEFGVPYSIDIPEDLINYITDSSKDIQLTATEDGLYVLNTNVVPAMLSKGTVGHYGAYIDLVGTNYGREYSIELDDVEVASETIGTDSGTLTAADIQSENIMRKLNTSLNTSSDFTSVVSGSTMFVIPNDDIFRKFDIKLRDGDNNNYLVAVDRVISSTKKLPKAGVRNHVVTVRPNTGGKESEYYLRYADREEVVEGTTSIGEPIAVPEAGTPWELSADIRGNDIFVKDGRYYRGFSTTINPNNIEGELTPTSFFGGTITDLVVSTTTVDPSLPIDFPSYYPWADQVMTLKLEWTNTDEPAPSEIEVSLNGKVYLLDEESAGVYKSNTLLSTPLYDPYGYLWRNQVTLSSVVINNAAGVNSRDIYEGGLWVETVEPGIDFRIDPYTMPIKFSLNSYTGQWTCSTVDWQSRRVGNNDNNERPSFIGKRINGMSLVQSRLCFITDDSVVFSRVDHETDFWRQSATTVVDDDRVDIESRDLESGPFRTITAHDKDIVIMGDAEQWVIRTANGITPANTVLQLASRYDNESGIQSASLGSSIAYPVWDGKYSQIREFYTRDDTGSNDSEYITSTIPKYIEGKITTLVSTTLNNYLIAHCAPSNEIYVMQWHNQNGARVMQSWCKWVLPNEPKYIYFDEGKLKFVMVSGDVVGEATKINTIDLSKDTYDGFDFNLHLDFREKITLASTQIVGLPTNHPYTDEGSFVVGASDSNYAGIPIPFQIWGGSVALEEMPGDVKVTGSILIGNKYTTSIKLPTIIPRDADDRVVSEQVLRLNSLKLRHYNSGSYSVNVNRSWGDYYSEDIESDFDLTRATGAADLDRPQLDTGEFRVPVRDRSKLIGITISTDSYLPYNLTGYDWSGQISGSGQRSNF